jgi:hypothetical protein
MSELPALTLLTLAATQLRGEAALLQAELTSTLLDFLLASPTTVARVAPARGADGALVLETAKGPVVIPNGPDFPPGTDVELRLASRAPPLVSVRVVASPAPAAPAAAGTGTSAAAPAPAAEIVPGSPLPAVLLAAPASDPRPPGTALLLRIIGIVLPAEDGTSERSPKGGAIVQGAAPPAADAPGKAAAEIPAEGPGGTAEPKALAAPTNAAGRETTASPPLAPRQPGEPGRPSPLPSPRTTEVPAGVPLPAPQRVKGADPAPLAFADGELVGPVVTRAAAGAVIQTPHHTIAVEGLDLPEGSLIRFLLLEPPATPAPPRPARSAPWETLGEALRALERDAPETAARLVADLHPHDPPRLAATIRLVAAALRDQSLPFPGKAVEDSLHSAGRADLVPALHDEMRALSRIASEPSQQWHVLPLPLHDGAQLTPAFLYVERDARRNAENGEEARRFVLDVQTRALGRLQLDGLLRPKRFDLLLRSRAPLDNVMRGEIERLFRATLDSAGWRGEVAFSTAPAFNDEPAGKYHHRVAALA